MRQGITKYLSALAMMSALLAVTIIGGGSTIASAGSDYGDFAENLPDNTKSIILAGGCFWCIEKDFEKLDAVYEVVSGYAGGTLDDLTYQSHEGHREVVQVHYNPDATDFETLIAYYYDHIDYQDDEGQFCDRGRAYTPAIHVQNDQERMIAKRLAPQSSVVPIEDDVKFWPAEQYHQDYYMKNPFRYKFYRGACGRDSRVRELRVERNS